jgi:hypothetical protein
LIRNWLRCLALAAGFSVAIPASGLAQKIDIAGVYRCEGKNPDGTAYRGLVEIEKHGPSYRVQWVMANRQTAVGIGIINGETLAVSYYNGANVGLVLYKIDKGPQLKGEWTLLGTPDGELYPETLTRVGLQVLDRHGTDQEPALVRKRAEQ